MDIVMIMKCDVCHTADLSGEMFGETGRWLNVQGEDLVSPDVCSFACLATWATNMAFAEEEAEREFE